MYSQTRDASRRVTATDLAKLRDKGEAIIAVSLHDAWMAELFDRAGAHILLVGDSLGMLFQGQPDTVGVTLEHIIYHTRAVRAGASRAHVVSDLPFLWASRNEDAALEALGRLMQEGGADSVKLEATERQIPLVTRAVEAGIPIMAHVGLRPQTARTLGGYPRQGRDAQSAATIRATAQALAQAGAYAVLVENVPDHLGSEITQQLTVPTIGIGAGVGCSGQILVAHDILGLSERTPPFARPFAELGIQAAAAARAYAQAVSSGQVGGRPPSTTRS